MTNNRTESRPLRVQLIDDDQGDYELLKEYLSEPEGAFELEWSSSLKAGMALLEKRRPDVLLLDLHLPDSHGLDTFFKVENEAAELPVVIVTGMDDEAGALEAVRRGAQDYLVKGRITAKTFPTTLRYAVERHRAVSKKGRVALMDQLTGLYNRDGFQVFAEQHLKAARRDNHAFYVFFAVLDGLAAINDKFGKTEGNQALLTTAAVLRESFRTSDVIARMGPDQFAIIAPDNSDYSPKAVTNRLQNSQTYYNAQYNRYRLSISVSASRIDPKQIDAPTGLVTKADQMFEEYKKSKGSDPDVKIVK
jgi:two-component system, cell cycle response regulator